MFGENASSRQCHILDTVATALSVLEDHLASCRVPSARAVASSKRPGFVAFLSAILRWPDVKQPECLILGHSIVGDIPPSGVFRSVSSQSTMSVEDWLSEAEEAIDRIMASKPPLHVQDILEATCDEQKKGYCSRLYSREEIDGMFGKSQWRPLERFLIVQPCGKKRVIDNTRKTSHNAATVMSETIHTVHIDFIASVLADLSSRLGLGTPPWDVPGLEWLQARIGTDDLPDAYRQLPVSPSQQGFSVISIHIPGVGWRFSLLWGLAFGLESAVVNFNRWPMLAIAASRRCACSLAAAYFDDELSVELLAQHDVSGPGLRCILNLMGSPPQQSKSFRPQCDRLYIWVLLSIWVTSLQMVLSDSSPSSLLVVKSWISSQWPSLPSRCPVMTQESSGGISNGCTLCALVSWGGLRVPFFPNTKARKYLISLRMNSVCCSYFKDLLQQPYPVTSRLFATSPPQPLFIRMLRMTVGFCALDGLSSNLTLYLLVALPSSQSQC